MNEKERKERMLLNAEGDRVVKNLYTALESPKKK